VLVLEKLFLENQDNVFFKYFEDEKGKITNTFDLGLYTDKGHALRAIN